MALEEQLAGWTGPSSTSEQEKQDRAERMVGDAIIAHPAFATMKRRVFAKGSYANNTNVRSDSDVDIAVQCQELLYCEEHSPGVKGYTAGPYVGQWTPDRLRFELILALERKFPGQVDTSGSIAIRIASNSARVDADVVPCFDFVHYYSSSTSVSGSRVVSITGKHITNYPDQQLANGKAKNNRTNYNYKKTVRILKRLENLLAARGDCAELPSYFMECLVYNVADSEFFFDTWTNTVKATLAAIYHASDGPEPSQNRWLEANGIKFLFHESQPWTRSDAKSFALAAWDYVAKS